MMFVIGKRSLEDNTLQGDENSEANDAVKAYENYGKNAIGHILFIT